MCGVMCVARSFGNNEYNGGWRYARKDYENHLILVLAGYLLFTHGLFKCVVVLDKWGIVGKKGERVGDSGEELFPTILYTIIDYSC